MEPTIQFAEQYASYLKQDVSLAVNNLQELVDNMLTRLEELTSVLNLIKVKNYECSIGVTEEVKKYRSEVNTITRKIDTLEEVLGKVSYNIERLERQVEKAETDFGITNDNKLKQLLKPFFKTNLKPCPTEESIDVSEIVSVMDYFESCKDI